VRDPTQWRVARRSPISVSLTTQPLRSAACNSVSGVSKSGLLVGPSNAFADQANGGMTLFNQPARYGMEAVDDRVSDRAQVRRPTVDRWIAGQAIDPRATERRPVRAWSTRARASGEPLIFGHVAESMAVRRTSFSTAWRSASSRTSTGRPRCSILQMAGGSCDRPPLPKLRSGCTALSASARPCQSGTRVFWPAGKDWDRSLRSLADTDPICERSVRALSAARRYRST